jgi:hypothetical protein
MSDGIKRMYEDAYEEAYRRGVERLSLKKHEEIYLLLKDIQSDILYLQQDDNLAMTRNQFAALSRIHNVVRELLA